MDEIEAWISEPKDEEMESVGLPNCLMYFD